MINMKTKIWALLVCTFGAFGILTISLYYPSVKSISRSLWTGAQPEYERSQNTLAAYPSKGSKTINIYFMRTHKTGSTTLYNIMARFAWKNNLRFATYQEEGLFGRTGRSTFEKVHFDKQMTKYNMFTEHSHYRHKDFNKIIFHPAFNLSILRNPITWLDSFLRYKKLVDPLMLNRTNAAESFIQNLDNEQWRRNNKHIVDSVGNWTTKHFLSNLTNTFNQDSFKMLDDLFLVGITEYFDESIILFRRKMGWSFEDIIYIPLCIQTYQKKKFYDLAMHDRFCQWASADCQLYEYFKKSFLDKFRNEGQEIVDEVKHYKDVLERVRKFCTPFHNKIKSKEFNISSTIFNEYSPLKIHHSKWHKSFTFTVKDCAFLRLQSMVFRAYFYYKQNNDKSCSGKCPVACSRRICHTICRNIKDETQLLNKLLVNNRSYIWDVKRESKISYIRA